jgi:putative endonuclease
VQHLRKKGLRILASNYRCPSGEADIVALDESTRSSLGSETIVFVEVKTRASDHFLPPQSAVDDNKRLQMRKVANYYLATHDTEGLHRRFDIVAITMPEGQEPCIEHIPDAFE